MVFYTSVFFRPISGTASDEPSLETPDSYLLNRGEQARSMAVAPIWKFELGAKYKMNSLFYLKRLGLCSAKLSKVGMTI